MEKEKIKDEEREKEEEKKEDPENPEEPKEDEEEKEDREELEDNVDTKEEEKENTPEEEGEDHKGDDISEAIKELKATQEKIKELDSENKKIKKNYNKLLIESKIKELNIRDDRKEYVLELANVDELDIEDSLKKIEEIVEKVPEFVDTKGGDVEGFSLSTPEGEGSKYEDTFNELYKKINNLI